MVSVSMTKGPVSFPSVPFVLTVWSAQRAGPAASKCHFFQIIKPVKRAIQFHSRGQVASDIQNVHGIAIQNHRRIPNFGLSDLIPKNHPIFHPVKPKILRFDSLSESPIVTLRDHQSALPWPFTPEVIPYRRDSQRTRSPFHAAA